MTLIAGFRVNGFPLLFGDAIVSAPSASGLERLPAVENLRVAYEHGRWQETDDRSRRPVRLRQKIALISDNVAVAWAGSQVAAQSLLGDLLAQVQDHPLSLSEIERALADLDDCNANRELSLIGMVADGTVISGFTHNIPDEQRTSAGPMVVAGSGAADFLNDVNAKGLPGPGSDLPHFEQAMGTALTIAGRMLALELHGGWNLPHFYGGAYEAAFFHDGKFRKMSDVTYAFWIARPHPDGVELGTMPARLIRQCYVDDVLVYRTASPSRDGAQVVIVEDNPHAIGPVYREPRAIDLSPCMGTFASNFICNLVICTDHQGVHRAVLSRVDARRGDDQPISFTTDANGGLQLTISRAGVYDLVDGIRPFYERLPTVRSSVTG